jgi:hypothetical protein
MKLADLPHDVLEDLCDDRWRLDITPTFEAKHEFWMQWSHFLRLREPYPGERDEDRPSEAHLAEFMTLEGYDVLLPVERQQHPHINLIRLMPSVDGQTLTIFLHNAFHRKYMGEKWVPRYGFLAVADRYRRFRCDFYLASYYHFCYLLHEDYETARRLLGM